MLRVVALAHVVELMQEGRGKLTIESVDIGLTAHGSKTFEQTDHKAQAGQIRFDEYVNVRPLYLDGDIFTGGQRGAMDLAQRCRGQWRPLEAGEKLIDRATEFMADRLLDGGKGHLAAPGPAGCPALRYIPAARRRRAYSGTGPV